MPVGSRRSRSVGMIRIIFVLLPAGFACRGTPAGESTAMIRDSAGVEIVEHPAGIPDGLDRWRLGDKPVLTIGAEGDPRYEFMEVTWVGQASDGSIIVLTSDKEDFRFRAFDSAGRSKWIYGRKGTGPGDLSQPWGSFIDAGDTLWSWDITLQRMSVIGPNGKLIRDFRLPDGVAGFVTGMLADRSFLMETSSGQGESSSDGQGESSDDRRMSIRMAIASSDGRKVDSLGTFEGPFGGGIAERGPLNYPFMIAGRDSMVVYGLVSRYELRMYRPDGRLLRIVRWARPPVRLSPTAKKYLTDPSTGFAIRPKVVESYTYPSFDAIAIDPSGRIWVQEPDTSSADPPIQQERKNHLWYVFSPRGELIAAADLERPGFVPLELRTDRVIGRMVNESGFQLVVVYPIERSPHPDP